MGKTSRLRLLSALGALLCVSTNSAVATDTTTSPDPCADIGSLSSDDQSLKDLYSQVKTLCAQRKIAAIGTAIQKDKYSVIADVLAGVGNIPVNSGTINGSDKTAHLGALQAQQTLFEAAVEVRTRLDGELASASLPYVLLTDSAAMQRRLSVRAAVAQISAMKSPLDKLRNRLDETPVVALSKSQARPKSAAATSERRLSAVVPALQLLPALVAGVQTIAGMAKSDATLFALTATGQRETIWAGLCKEGCTNIRVPGADTSATMSTVFQKTYSELESAASAAREVLAKKQRQIQEAGGDDKVSLEVTELRDALAAQMREVDALDQRLHSPQSGKMTTLFEDLVESDLATFGGGGTLLVTVAEIGGHGGTVSSKWALGANDKLSFETTVALSFVLFNSDGTVKKAGFVSNGHTSIRDPQTTGLNGVTPERRILSGSISSAERSQ